MQAELYRKQTMGQAMRTTAKAILVSAKKMTCRTKGKGWKDGAPAH